MTVYDTLTHQINGFSQHQSSGASLAFSSSHGLVDIASLPVVSTDEASQAESLPTQEKPVGTQSVAGEADVLVTIEKLAQLHVKGILTDDEFAAKKKELMGRL